MTPPLARVTEPIILLCDADDERREMVKSALRRSSSNPVVELRASDELERELHRRSAGLVITSVRLGDSSALHSIGRARSAGFRAPFIVYTALTGTLMRVLVNGGDGTVLSNRVVDLKNFADLVQILVKPRRPSFEERVNHEV